MSDILHKYFLHLEELRIDSGMKIKDFCDGVCDRRSYSMYLSGERAVSQRMLNSFCEKVGLTMKEFLASYNHFDQDEYREVAKMYQLISERKYDEARKILMVYDNHEFHNILAKKLYDFSVIEYNLRTSSITPAHAYDLHKNLINYPECLNKKKFNLQEILSIRSIAILEFEIKEYRALNFLKDLLSGESDYQFVSSDNRDIVPYIYSLVIKRLGMLGDFEGSLKVSRRALMYLLGVGTTNELEQITYYAFLSSVEVGDNEKRDFYAKKVIALVHALKGPDFIKHRLDMMARDISDEYVEDILNSFKRL